MLRPKVHMLTWQLALCCLSLPASAVIVAGASGGGNTTNNTTPAQYFTETGTQLPQLDNVILYGGNGSGVYLGYDADTREVWVLTARHIGTNSSAGSAVTIDGLSYDRVSSGAEYAELVIGDLRLVKYKRADNQVPSLGALSLSATIPTASTSLVMAGFGRNRVEHAATSADMNDSTSTGVGTGYHWDASRIMRWGTNQIEDLGGGSTLTDVNLGLGYTTTTFVTDFDQPSSGQWLSANEAQGSSGDSGGAAFINIDGTWILAGIMSAIGTDAGQDASSAAFGNLTYITDLSTYASDIQNAIGVTLIPEPSWSALLGATGILALRRRRLSTM